MKKRELPWVKTIRRETGLIEHICKHGIGHPDPDSLAWLKNRGSKDGGIHGCDGCCIPKKEARMPDMKQIAPQQKGG